MTPTFRRIKSIPRYRGYVITVESQEFESPTGERFVRDVVHTPGAVVIAPILTSASGEFQIVMIQQWRASVGRVLWELPAGLRDVPGEPPRVTAQRELIEEVGYEAGTIDLLSVTLASPGFTNAAHHYFLATELRFVGTNLQGPEELAMNTATLSLRAAKSMVLSGEIDNGPAVIGILLACERLGVSGGSGQNH